YDELVLVCQLREGRSKRVHFAPERARIGHADIDADSRKFRGDFAHADRGRIARLVRDDEHPEPGIPLRQDRAYVLIESRIEAAHREEDDRSREERTEARTHRAPPGGPEPHPKDD